MGSARELVAACGAVTFVPLSFGTLPAAPSAVALIFDLRSATVGDLAEARAHPSLALLPLLLLSATEIGEAAFDLLRADDGFVVDGAAAHQLRRRVAALVELGRLRIAARRRAARPDTQLQFLDLVEVGIVTADAAGRVTFANRAAAQLLRVDEITRGAPVERALGLTEGPAAMLAGQARCVVPRAQRMARGDALDLEISIRASEPEDHVAFVILIRDVRDEAQHEGERRRLGHLAAMGTMVAGFAHEVRNPVAAMRSIAEELAEELRDAGLIMPHVGRMLQMVERIERLVRTLLRFGRPAAPKRMLQRPWVIAAAAVTGVGPRIRGSGEELVVEVEPDLPDVNVDESQLAQALVILLDNALDATGSIARVTLRIRRAKAQEADRTRSNDPAPLSAVRFEVIDDGAGIPEDILDQIFDPFFTTKPTGTGLGLSIAQQLIRENGAHLDVAALPGSPTCFSITIPTGTSIPPPEVERRGGAG